MARITGQEELLPEKVLLLYKTIGLYMEEKADFNTLKVAEIAKRAEIGKGTVYEYFETKEDLIALAFLFNIKNQIAELKNILYQIHGFEQKLTAIFNILDSQASNRECMIHFFRMSGESSSINQRVHAYMEQNKRNADMPVGLIVKLVRDACEEKGLLEKANQEYITFEVCSKILGYLFWMHDEPKEKYMTRDAMRARIIRSILIQMNDK